MHTGAKPANLWVCYYFILLFSKPRSAVAVNRDRDVAVAVAVAVGSDDRDQFFALTTATDFVLSPHAYVHNVEQSFYIY